MKRRIATLNFTLAVVGGALISLSPDCGNAKEPEVIAEGDGVTTARQQATPATESPQKTNSAASAKPAVPSAIDPAVVALSETNSSASVEHRIFYISNAEATDLEKAQALFLLLPTLDKDGQRKVAHGAVRYVDDAHYSLIRDRLMDKDLHPQVLSVFMTDTMKRKDAIKLPVILDIARYDGHPNQAEAMELLHLYLRQNYGTDWDKWQAAVNAKLEAQPD